MLEERKQKEIAHYDEKAREANSDQRGDFEGFEPQQLSSYRFFYTLIGQYSAGKKVLDYGCGNGIHSAFPAKLGAQVTGIDLSKLSLQTARQRMQKERVGDRVSFLEMDCENLEFEDNSFDVIMDGGTFSSLDLKKAIPELARVLKSEGIVIGIETLGHNPVTNLKRKLNRETGKRTEWAEGHILQMKDLEFVRQYFKEVEAHYFHLISWIVFPFLRFPGGNILLRMAEILETPFIWIPFFRRYCFKIVLVFKGPKKA